MEPPATPAVAVPVAPPKKPGLVRRLLPLVGLAMAVAFVAHLDVAAMVDVVKAADPVFVVVAAVAMTVNTLLKGWRWHRMLKAQAGVDVSPAACAWLFIEANFLGSFTIGRIGEFVRVSRLADRGVDVGVALASCLVDRGLDLVALVVIGAACLAGLEYGVGYGVAVGVVGVVATFAGSVVARAVVGAPVADGPGLVLKVKRMVRTGAFFALPAVLFEAMLWTLVSWSVAFCVVISLAHALALPASVPSLTAAHSISGVSTLLPFTYQGVGTRELIFAAILRRDGVTGPQAVVLAELTFVVMLSTGVLLGLVEVFTRRLRRATKSAPAAATTDSASVLGKSGNT